MQSMKGATSLLGSMNRQMNLPALQRIAMEFEKENDIMDQREEMMDDAIDDVTGLEDEEEGEEVVKEVLDEIGVDLGQAVWDSRNSKGAFAVKATMLTTSSLHRWERHPQACRRPRLQMDELQKLLAVLEEVEEAAVQANQKMTIFKLVSIVCGDRIPLCKTFLFTNAMNIYRGSTLSDHEDLTEVTTMKSSGIQKFYVSCNIIGNGVLSSDWPGAQNLCTQVRTFPSPKAQISEGR